VSGFVVDASALLPILLGISPDPQLRRHLLTSGNFAPDLIGIELLHALRRKEIQGELDRAAADEAAARAEAAPIARMPHRPLLPRIWELRGAITAYDAAYVALAEQLDVPLLTCDARLARANGHRAEILAFPVA
jgi:predicted nucleic acid-binding protein